MASAERSRASSPGPAERAAQVAAEQAERWASARPARRACSTTARASASVRTTTPSSGSAPGPAPRLALADRHGHRRRRRPTDDAADHAAANDPRRPPRRAVRGRWPARGRPRPTWRSRSMSSLTLRTKSPPDRSSSPSTSSSASPAAQAWARAKNPGSGGRVAGRPERLPRRRCSSAASWSSCADPPPHVGRREPRRGRRVRAAVLVGEARHQAGQAGRVEVVEQPGLERLGHQQVALVEDAAPAARPRSVSAQPSRWPQASSSCSTWSKRRASDSVRPWIWRSRSATSRLDPLGLARRPGGGRRGRGSRPPGASAPGRRPAARRRRRLGRRRRRGAGRLGASTRAQRPGPPRAGRSRLLGRERRRAGRRGRARRVGRRSRRCPG